jgi:hypothetical protein
MEDQTFIPSRPLEIEEDKLTFGRRVNEFPWWFLAMILIAVWAFFIIFTNENYNEAFNFIKAGLNITVKTSLTAYGVARQNIPYSLWGCSYLWFNRRTWTYLKQCGFQ